MSGESRDFDEARLYLADPVTVTLRRPATQTAAAASATVANVQEQPATQETVDHPNGGTLDVVRKVFHLWAIECGGLTPYEDYEVVTADGAVWVAKRVERLAHGRRFRVHTIQRSDTT